MGAFARIEGKGRASGALNSVLDAVAGASAAGCGAPAARKGGASVGKCASAVQNGASDAGEHTPPFVKSDPVLLPKFAASRGIDTRSTLAGPTGC